MRAAWLRFPGFTLEPLDQLYRRTAPLVWRYEGGSFVRNLEVNETGFVTRYPGFWQSKGRGDALILLKPQLLPDARHRRPSTGEAGFGPALPAGQDRLDFRPAGLGFDRLSRRLA